MLFLCSSMSPYLFLAFVVGYFVLLWTIGFITSRGADNQSFFVGNRQSPWFVVAFGMIGASLSGVTFISVPGWVADSQFSYMQMVLGYVPGYCVIAFVLMPMYYRLKLTSIYTYLESRFGPRSYESGSWLFLVSRLIGSSFRLYLVAIVLQIAVFDRLGLDIPFVVTVIVTVVLIWLYTYRGGIKTIIWTDTLQTAFMLAAVALTIISIMQSMNLDFGAMVELIDKSDYSQVWFFDDWNDPRHFFKNFFGGMFIAIVMTGLDQDMMQKNLSCKNIGDAQKNVLSLAGILIFVNLMFLSLGALLYIFANSEGLTIPEQGDYLYPTLAVDGYLGPVVAMLFVLGLIASAYSSADSALTALTTSFAVDILKVGDREEGVARRIRKRVHIGMSAAIVIVIMIFKSINDESVISQVFTVAGYTYGPLLGLYSYGLFTRRPVDDRWVPWICIISPIICYFLSDYSKVLFNGFEFGFELLLVNGAITLAGLWLSSLVSKKK